MFESQIEAIVVFLYCQILSLYASYCLGKYFSDEKWRERINKYAPDFWHNANWMTPKRRPPRPMSEQEQISGDFCGSNYLKLSKHTEPPEIKKKGKNENE